MDNVALTNSTTVTANGAVSAGFVIGFMNDKQVGIPIYTFEYSNPPIDLVTPPIDLKITNGTILTDETIWLSGYNAAIAVIINDTPYGWPLYRVPQQDIDQQLTYHSPTIMSSLTAVEDEYVVISIDDSVYGVPLYSYGSAYPFTSVSAMSALPEPATQLAVGEPTRAAGADYPEVRGSTHLNSKIKTYQHLIDRIKYQLGAPFINIEICEDVQMVDFIDKAIEWYTKYAGFTEEYLVFHSHLYTEPGLKLDDLFSLTATMRNTTFDGTSGCWDYDLGEYRKVVGLFSFEQGETTGINSLFTLEQAMAQQTYFSYMLGNAGFDLVTWECLKGWLDLREKVLAQVPYVDFDQDNQLLRIIPAPNKNSGYYGVVGAWVEKPIKHLVKERWVEHYALALSKISIGNIRGKYQSIQMFGGGSINYNDLLSQGLEEKKALEAELMDGYGEATPARFFIG